MFTKKCGKDQEEIFNSISNSVERIYYEFNLGKTNKEQKNVKTEWAENVKNIKQMFTGKKLKKDFLNNGVIAQAVFMNSQGDLMKHQIDFCETKFDKETLGKILLESPVGNPQKAMMREYDTTHNSIHHLYHIARYMRSTKKDFSILERIIEWGGGYGNFCKIVCSLPQSKLKTYTIVDLPEMCALQWAYLVSVFGKDKVNIVSNNTKIVENKINLVSIENLEKLDDDYNGFVSTWALSESPTIMHDFVNSKNWFNADSMLMSIHQCGDHIPFMKESTNVGLLAKKFGARIEDIQVIPGKNYYIFK